LWNVIIHANPLFVIMRNWNWNKKYLINCSCSNFACLNISKLSFWYNLLKIFSFIAWMLLVLFVFKASSFGLVGLGLNFALLQPFGGRLVFYLIYLVATMLWYVCFQSMFLLSSRSKLSFHILDINLILVNYMLD
jgi:hypothetical protein